jgi:hypothetical protein
MFRLLLAALVAFLCTQPVLAEYDSVNEARNDLSTGLMWDTFCIGGAGALPNQMTFGTGFLLSREFPPDDPRLKNDPTTRDVFLVTAAHVLEGISGDTAIIQFRDRQDNGDWKALPVKVPIRKGGVPMWTRNADSKIDIAVMRLLLNPEVVKRLQKNIVILPTSLLADDALLTKFHLHPGMTLFALGFPLRVASNDAGFPILRSGTIASYPILPTKKYKTFYFDFEVFGGNSGGPVFLSVDNPALPNGMMLGRLQAIVGLVTQQMSFANNGSTESLKIGVVITSTLIKETIDSLPPG